MILSKKFQDIIHGAIYLAVNELNHQYLTCEHILFCALDNKDVIKMFESFDVNISGLRNKLYQFLQYDLYDLTNKNLENNRIIKLKFTDHLVNFFERLVLRGNKNHSLLNGEIDIEDFILEILFDHESYSYFFLKKFNLNKDDLISYLKENEKKNFKKSQSKDFGSEINDFLGQSSDKFKKNSDFLNSNKVDFFSSDESLFGEHFDSSKNPNAQSSTNDKQKQFSQKQFSNYFGFSGKNQSSNHSNFYNGNFSSGASGLNSSHLGYLSGLNEEKDKSKNSILENYCVNFNLAAQKGKIDPIFDRDEEIEMLLKALYCRRKGNALLIGDSGVGKTAIIEYLAQKIVNNDKEIPSRLKNALIYSLDLNSLISGTRYRGDLEERMKFLMNEIEASKQKIILFIDEIHTVIGTGSTNNGTLDIGNILKPYLARSMIYCIGATTRKEFAQFLSKDKAFLRRFQIIFVNEPSVQSAQKMITGIIGKYESYHNVKYTKGAIEASVLLCKRYISEKHLPDGALDLIDYAGSSACINSEQKKAMQLNGNVKNQSSLITRKDIEDAIAEIIKLPKKQISSTAFAKNLLEMKDFLNTKIIGQESAIDAVCKSIIANTSEIVSSKDTNSKPIASYIFYGPTGVGKTELAIQLSNYLNMKFIRIDMSEFSESHSVSKLFGAPPGYVGFEQSGILTEQVLKNPYSVILFDEIEKAHPNLMNSLLQILDYGNLTDNFGQKVSFSHSIIICTTNSGSKSMSKITPGFNSFGNLEITLKELENSFSPEFRNRFSSIVSFKSLDSSIISKIIQSKFNEISANLKKKNIELEIDQNITQFIIDKKYDSSMGARIIDRIIEDEITSKLSKLFFESKVEKKGQIKKIILDLNNFDQKANNDDESETIEDNIKITLL